MDQIKELIASGQLKPNEKIPTEAELAEMFGIGRSTVREAIKIFQYLGILDVSHKGTFVGDHTTVSTEAVTWSLLLRKSDISELIDLREVIEERAVRTLAEWAAQDGQNARAIILQLEEQVARMGQAVRESSISGMVEADYEFHRLVISLGGNALFASIYDTLRYFMLEEIRKTNMQETTRSVLVEEHGAIVAAIVSGDSEESVRAVRAHITTKYAGNYGCLHR